MLRPKPGGRCPPSSLPKGPLPGWPFAQGESCPGGPLPREKVAQGALCPGGKLPRGDLSPRAYAFDVWNCEKTLFYLEIHDELWIKVPSVVFAGYDLSSQHLTSIWPVYDTQDPPGGSWDHGGTWVWPFIPTQLHKFHIAKKQADLGEDDIKKHFQIKE